MNGTRASGPERAVKELRTTDLLCFGNVLRGRFDSQVERLLFQTTRAALLASGRTTGESMESFMARLPLRRMGEPDDIAKVVLFLASAAADYMTGSLVLVDGGFLLS